MLVQFIGLADIAVFQIDFLQRHLAISDELPVAFAFGGIHNHIFIPWIIRFQVFGITAFPMKGDDTFPQELAQIVIDTCAINTNIANATRDIVDSQNANTRSILDALTAQRIADKDAQILAQSQQIAALQLAASQQAQNNYLISQLKAPCPIPAYQVPNPNCCYANVNNGCGCGNL